MSERGNGSQMDYLELKRMHDRYKSKQRMANLANKKPQRAADDAEPVRAAAPAVKEPVPAPKEAVEEAPRRGAQADSVVQAEPEPAEELELGGDQDAGEEIYDTGEPDEEPAARGAGMFSDNQNPFNQFFVAFGKMKDKMAERKAKKAELEGVDSGDEPAHEDGEPEDPALADLGEGAFEDEPQGGMLGKLTGAFKKFSFGRKKDPELDDLTDEELAELDLELDEEEYGDEFDGDPAGEADGAEPAGEIPAAQPAEQPAADAAVDAAPVPTGAYEPEEDAADEAEYGFDGADEDFDDAGFDDEDFDDEDEDDEEEAPRKKRGLKNMFNLFVRREEKTPEPEEEEMVEDDFSFDFDVFGEQFQPVIADEQPVIPKGDDTVEETREKSVRAEENSAVQEVQEIMTAGLSRRERRELAMKKAQEEAARLEAALAAAGADDEPTQEPAAPAAEPVQEESAPAAEPAPVEEEPAEPQREATPSIFDDPVTDELLIAQVDEPTREFRPVHAVPAAEPAPLFGEEEDPEEEEEEEKPVKRGLFGRQKAKKPVEEPEEEEEEDEEEEKPARKSRRSRRDEEEDEEEEEAPRRSRRSRRDEEEDEEDEEEYESRRSRRERRRVRDEEEDEYEEYESRRSRRSRYEDEEEDDDIDYDNYDYNDDDGAGHGFLYHLSGFLKAVTVFIIVLLVIVIGLNVWEFIGNRNGSDSPVDTLSEHLREYAPEVFDVLFPVAENLPEEGEADDSTIELGDGWDTSEEQDDTAAEGEPDLVG